MTSLPHLLQQSRAELMALAAERGLGLRPHLEHDALVADIVSDMLQRDELVTTDGVLTILPEGFGFVRMLAQDFENTAVDVYVSGNQVRSLNLQAGQRIRGPIRAPRGTERTFALLHIDLVQDSAPEELLAVTGFASRTPVAATRPLRIVPFGSQHEPADPDLQALQLLAPICFGHRALVHAPATYARAQLLARMARGLRPQQQPLDVTLCLLEQRPEDIASARELLRDTACSVVSTAFAAPPERHVTVAELALYRCMRQVEQGHDVVLLLDSLTALTRARSRTAAPSGAWIQPGLDAKSILPAKQVLESARQCAEGGSLTVIASVTTGALNTIDAAIEQEFVAYTNSDFVVLAATASDDAWPWDLERTRTRSGDDATPAELRRQVDGLRQELQELPLAQRAARLASFGVSASKN